MLVTETEARGMNCPYGDRCIASRCMQWRWARQFASPRMAETIFHNFPDEEIDRWRVEEPPRPPQVPATWVWFPVTGSDIEDLSGGFWEEPAAAVQADNEIARAAEQGYCGLGLKPIF